MLASATVRVLLLLLGHASALTLPGPSTIRPKSLRCSGAHLGFDVEDVEEKAVGEMGVMGWPGLEKRTSDFSQSATADELLMVYVKEGTATLADDDETRQVSGERYRGALMLGAVGRETLERLSNELSLMEVNRTVGQVVALDAEQVLHGALVNDVPLLSKP